MKESMTGNPELMHEHNIGDGQSDRFQVYEENEVADNQPETSLDEKRAKLKEYFQGRLEQEGIMERGPNGETIIDLQSLIKGSGELSRRSFDVLKKQFPEFLGKGRVHIQNVLLHTFQGEKVISAEDFRGADKDKPQPKDLFYQPENPGDVYDVDKVKKSDFYLAAWDIGGKIQYDGDLPTKDGQAAPMNEAVLSALIYHPKYGDGYRDKETGKLMVRHPQTREYQPITHQWLVQDMGFSGGNLTDGGKQIRKTNAIGKYLSKEAPQIARAGLLTPGDFRELGTAEEKLERRRSSNVEPGGFIMIDSVRYYIGKGEPLSGATVSKISPEYGGVVMPNENGESGLKYIFPLKTDPAELEKLGVSASRTGKVGFHYTTKEQTGMREYNPDEFFVRRADETEGQFGERKKSMDNFSELLKLSDLFTRESGINISSLKFEEQRAIALAAKTLSPEEVVEFGQTYGLDGLRALRAIEYDRDMGRRVIELGRQLPKTEASQLFKEYGQLTGLSDKFADLFRNSASLKISKLPSQLQKDFPVQVQEAILRRSKDLLLASHLVSVEHRPADLKQPDIQQATAGLRTMLESLASISGSLDRFTAQPVINMEKNRVAFPQNLFQYDIQDRQTHHTYKLKIHIRPRAEKGGEDQARINMELDFATSNPNADLQKAFQQETTYLAKGNKKQESVLRLGVDRDDRKGQQFVSLDVGRNKFTDANFQRTGDVLGNALSLVDEAGHHTTKSFQTELAAPDNFASLASALDAYLEKQRLEYYWLTNKAT